MKFNKALCQCVCCVVLQSCLFAQERGDVIIHNMDTYFEEFKESSSSKEDLKNLKNISHESSDTVIHDFQLDKNVMYNPLFLRKKEIGLTYSAILGLSDSQTLIFHGATLKYLHPYIHEKIQVQFLALATFGNALLTTQNQQNSLFHYAFMGSSHISIPLNTKHVATHMVFGMDIGLSSIVMQSINFMGYTYFGFDFLYHDFVFRPFIGVVAFMPFDNARLHPHYTGELGFSTFYKLDNILVSSSVSLLGSLSQNNAGIFSIMPNMRAIYLQRTSSHLNFDLGVEYASYEYLHLKAQLFAHYTMSFYNINIGASLGVVYHF